MHFTIPYTDQIVDNDGKKIDIYKVYINGAHHCSARYSRFHALYNGLKQRFPADELPLFPPRRLLRLSESQIEERREALEHFLQKVSSASRLNSDELHEFLQTSQKETKNIVPEPVQIAIYLMDGTKNSLNIQTTDHTKTVFDTFANLINLPKVISSKFGLFFMEIHEDKKLSIIRKLQDFEYPYISLKEIRKHCNCRIVVRKSVWNTELEKEVDHYNVGLQILFAQVSVELKIGWISIPDQARSDRLTNLIERGSKKETLQLARTLDYYGYVQLYGVSVCSRPLPNTKCTVSTGNFELVFRDSETGEMLVKYCLTRIKAWKISTTLRDSSGEHSDRYSNKSAGNFATLTFENWDSENKRLEEITIMNSHTNQIILLSMSLKNMAEEYVSMKNGSCISDSGGSDTIDEHANRVKIISNDGYRAAFMMSAYIGDGDL